MHASGNAMMQDARTAAASRKKNAVAAKSDGHKSGRTEPVIQHYEAAVLLL